jgi:hypothetical protein
MPGIESTKLPTRTGKRKYLRILLWSIGVAVLLQIIFTGIVMAHNCEPGNEADCMRTAGYLVAVSTGGGLAAGLAAGTVNSIIGGSTAAPSIPTGVAPVTGGAAGVYTGETAEPGADTQLDDGHTDKPGSTPSEETKPPDEVETTDKPKPPGATQPAGETTPSGDVGTGDEPKPSDATPPSQESTPFGSSGTTDRQQPLGDAGTPGQTTPPDGDLASATLPGSAYTDADSVSSAVPSQNIADMIGQGQSTPMVAGPAGMFTGLTTAAAGPFMPNTSNMTPEQTERWQRIQSLMDRLRTGGGGLPSSGGAGQNLADALSPSPGVEGVSPGGGRSPQFGDRQTTPVPPGDEERDWATEFGDLLDEDADTQSTTPAGTTGEADQQTSSGSDGGLIAEDVDTGPDGSDIRKPPEGETQSGDDAGTPAGGDDEQTGPQTIRYTTGGVTFERTEYPDGRPPEITVVSGSSYTDGVATIDLDRDLYTGDVTGGHLNITNPDANLSRLDIDHDAELGTSGDFVYGDRNIQMTGSYDLDNNTDVSIQSVRDDTLFDSMGIHLEPGGGDTGELHISDHNIAGDLTYNEQNHLDINLQSARDDTLFDSMQVHLEPGGADTGELHISDHNITGDLTYNEQNHLDINLQTVRNDTLFDSMQVHLEPGGADTGELHLSDHNIEGSATYDAENRLNVNINSVREDSFMDQFTLHSGGGQEFEAGMTFSDRNVEGFVEYNAADQLNVDLHIKSPDAVLQDLHVGAGGGQPFNVDADFNLGRSDFNLGAEYTEDSGTSVRLTHDQSPVGVQWDSESHRVSPILNVQMPHDTTVSFSGPGQLQNFNPVDQMTQDLMPETPGGGGTDVKWQFGVTKQF